MNSNTDTSSITPIIASVGNPNVDFTVKLPTTSLLLKYKLFESNSSQEVSYKFLNEVRNDAIQCKYESKYSPGGVEQNTLRIFQWLLGDPYKTVIFGSIGNDEDSKRLREQMEKSNVITRYVVIDGCETSKIVILSHKENRCALANIGAARLYSLDHMSVEDFKIIDKADIVYFGGFFTVHSPDVGIELVNRYRASHIICYNISGVYVVKQQLPTDTLAFCQNCDILVGNLDEYKALAGLLNLDENDIPALLKQVHAKMLSNSGEKFKLPYMKDLKKVAIVTDGSNSLSCIFGNGQFITLDIPLLDKRPIVDTTGAGDAFMAGFLYGLINRIGIKNCLQIGCKVAQEIIREHGVNIPKSDPSSILKSYKTLI